ncbi:hypothetical protein KY349_04710 [Candidatus Woesearchaeota archaeon]|nr:hypothetical protein [Candidatus Woesearchaeota archaeon]
MYETKQFTAKDFNYVPQNSTEMKELEDRVSTLLERVSIMGEGKLLATKGKIRMDIEPQDQNSHIGSITDWSEGKETPVNWCRAAPDWIVLTVNDFTYCIHYKQDNKEKPAN